jgi:REP element-mobilizing transposase RayT
MGTYRQIHYHIVFSTKNRLPSLDKPHREMLYKYIWGILKKNRCYLYRINGTENHLHLLIHLHPSVSLAHLIKDIKLASSDFIKRENLFPNFTGWQKGYGAFTHHVQDKYRLIEYIKNQEDHHKTVSWKQEFRSLLKEHEIDFNEKYLL